MGEQERRDGEVTEAAGAPRLRRGEMAAQDEDAAAARRDDAEAAMR